MATVETRHIGADLIRRIDDEVGRAIQDVESEESKSAKVAVSFGIALDEEGRVEVSFTNQHARTDKGSWQPGVRSQLRLSGTDN